MGWIEKGRDERAVRMPMQIALRLLALARINAPRNESNLSRDNTMMQTNDLHNS